MANKEWHPNYPNWLKETKCTPCRMPTHDIGRNKKLSYKPVKCRDCKHANISKCSECGKEIRYCMVHPQNGPPSLDIDKPRQCVLFKPKEDE